MNRQQPKDPGWFQDSKDNKSRRVTGYGGLYDRHGPIPVPDAHESDTDSTWALFEESPVRAGSPETEPASVFEETVLQEEFEPTDFLDPANDASNVERLKP
jgi:hypothetical protein